MSQCEYRSSNSHNHELLGSVQLPTNNVEAHNHRFAVVTDEAIPICGGDDHVHEVCFTTDTYEGHDHEFRGRTGSAIWIGDRHVHCIDDTVEPERGHVHCFRAVTLINDPIGEE